MPDSEAAANRELPLLLTYEETAHELGGISERHVHELIKRGLLERVKLLRSARITSESVKKLAKAK